MLQGLDLVLPYLRAKKKNGAPQCCGTGTRNASGQAAKPQKRKESTEAVGKVTGPLRIIPSLVQGLVWLFFKLFHPFGVWSGFKKLI